MLSFCKQARTCLKILLVSSLFVTGIAYFKRATLPERSKISAELRTDPIQTTTTQKPFSFKYLGDEYLVSPQANYEIKGLLVTHNDITSFWDMYHDENSVDIKDFCLIWGQNVQNEIYNKVKFWSESVSCHYQINDSDTYEDFRGDQLSNNHLLSDSEAVRKKIKLARIGDQVELSGYLVNYSSANHPGFVRESSLVRTDEGGGACEVFYVTDFRFIKKTPRFWYETFAWSKRVFFISLASLFLLFIVIPQLEYRRP